jgi:hypothetical protein
VFLQGEYGVHDQFLGVPVKLGKGGAEKVIEIKLTPEENAAPDEVGGGREGADDGDWRLAQNRGLSRWSLTAEPTAPRDERTSEQTDDGWHNPYLARASVQARCRVGDADTGRFARSSLWRVECCRMSAHRRRMCWGHAMNLRRDRPRSKSACADPLNLSRRSLGPASVPHDRFAVTLPRRMKIHEYQAKRSPKRTASRPAGRVAFTADEARKAAETWRRHRRRQGADSRRRPRQGRRRQGRQGPGRGVDAAQGMLGMTLVTHQTGPRAGSSARARREGLTIARELYLGLVIDRSTERPC